MSWYYVEISDSDGEHVYGVQLYANSAKNAKEIARLIIADKLECREEFLVSGFANKTDFLPTRKSEAHTYFIERI